MNLSELPRGRAGTVRTVGGERVVRVRLMELGLLPGTPVRVVRVAPLGDPLVIEVRGCELSVRASEARHVELEAQARG